VSGVHLPAIFAPTWGDRWMVDAEGKVMRSKGASEWKLVMRVPEAQIQPVASVLDLIAYAWEQGNMIGKDEGRADLRNQLNALLTGSDD
jgi:hypothetical protein